MSTNVNGYNYGISPVYSTGYPTAQPTTQPTTSSSGYNVNFNVKPDAVLLNVGSVASTVAPAAPGAVAGNIVKDAYRLSHRRYAGARNARYMSKVRTPYRSSTRYKSKSAVKTGSGTMFAGIKDAVKKSVLWGGLISLGLNGWQVYKKQESVADAGTNVAGDLASSVVGGAAAAVATSMAAPILGGIFGTMGFMVTLGGIGVGIAGYMIADHFLRKTSFFQNMQATVHAALSHGQ